MRVHHLYRFDDDDMPPLTASTFVEIHSYVIAQRSEDEAFEAFHGVKNVPREIATSLAYRAERAINRLRHGTAFTAADMDAACAFLAVLVERHAGKIETLRAEGERMATNEQTRTVYDRLIDGSESTHKRMARLLADLNASYAGAFAAAELADGHP